VNRATPAPRAGLTAKCRRRDGRKQIVSDVEFSHGPEGDRRETADLAIGAHQQVELAVLSAKSQTARCGFLGSGPHRHPAKSQALGAGRNCMSETAQSMDLR